MSYDDASEADRVIREALFGQHEAVLRIRSWFNVHLDDDPAPVKWRWGDPSAAPMDLLSPIVVTFSDGHEANMVPARDMPAPIMKHDYEPGEEFHPMQTDPLCGVCGNPRSDWCHS